MDIKSSVTPRRMALALGLMLGGFGLSACDPSATGYSGGAYYDSMMWNDYYWYDDPGYRPPVDRPDRPDRPVKPRPPVSTLPAPAPRPPVARPPVARPPIHRPR